MRVNSSSYLLNVGFFALALLLSVAIGAVFIPPDTLLRMIISALPGIPVSGDWPETFTVIIFRIRLPHTILILLTGAALAGSRNSSIGFDAGLTRESSGSSQY